MVKPTKAMLWEWPAISSGAVMDQTSPGKGLSQLTRTLGTVQSSPLAAPGRDEEADREQQRGDGGDQRRFAEAGHDIVAVFAQPDPVVAGGGATGRHPADVGHRAVADPEHAAAARLRGRTELVGGGADVAELDRV